VRESRTRAGDAYIAYSRKLTIGDDNGYGEALWKGIDLYDRAANVQCVISALDLFANERPEDPLTPDALLKLGRAYQAAGLFDKAIEAFSRNQFRYPRVWPPANRPCRWRKRISRKGRKRSRKPRPC